MPQASKPHPEGKFAYQRIRRHFHPAAVEQLVTTSRFFPDRLKVELAKPLADLTAEVGPVGFTGLYFTNDRDAFAALLVDDEKKAARIAASHFEEVELGQDAHFPCLKNGLWLGGDGDARYAVFYIYDTEFNGESKMRLEVAVMPGDAGAHTATRTVAEITRRTKGVTASFIKELMRRGAQTWLEAGGAGAIAGDTFVRAIEEMTLAGGRFNAKLLGAGDAIGFVRAA